MQGFNPPRQVKSRSIETGETIVGYPTHVQHENRPTIPQDNRTSPTIKKAPSLYNVIGKNKIDCVDSSTSNPAMNVTGAVQEEYTNYRNNVQTFEATVTLPVVPSSTGMVMSSVSEETCSVYDANIPSELGETLHSGKHSPWSVIGSSGRNCENQQTGQNTLMSCMNDSTKCKQSPCQQTNDDNNVRDIGVPSNSIEPNPKRSTSQILKLIGSIKRPGTCDGRSNNSSPSLIIADVQKIPDLENNMQYSNEETSSLTEHYDTLDDDNEKASLDRETTDIGKCEIRTGKVNTTIRGDTDQVNFEIHDTATEDSVGNSPCFDLSFSPLSNVSLTDDEDPTKITQSQSASPNQSENTNVNSNRGKTNVPNMDGRSEQTDSCRSSAMDNRSKPRFNGPNRSPQQVENEKLNSLIDVNHRHKSSSNDLIMNNEYQFGSQDMMSTEDNSKAQGEGPVTIKSKNENTRVQEISKDKDNSSHKQSANETEMSSRLTDGSERISDSQLLSCLTMVESNLNVEKCNSGGNDAESTMRGKGNVENPENSLNDLKFSPDDHNFYLASSR